jgi:hypothetical protein
MLVVHSTDLELNRPGTKKQLMDFELYAQTLQKTMADAIAAADKLSAAAGKDRAAAINDSNRADQLPRDWEWASYQKAVAFVNKNRKKNNRRTAK